MAGLRYKREFSTKGYRQDSPQFDTFDRVNNGGVVVVSRVSPMIDSQREQWRINDHYDVTSSHFCAQPLSQVEDLQSQNEDLQSQIEDLRRRIAFLNKQKDILKSKQEAVAKIQALAQAK
ncbi:MAG: hypothetical protein CMD74_02585 [Gammaproteobacteria bacterium]|nr:hypothetical protein [Gammaproteobacteria bacterium]